MVGDGFDDGVGKAPKPYKIGSHRRMHGAKLSLLCFEPRGVLVCRFGNNTLVLFAITRGEDQCADIVEQSRDEGTLGGPLIQSLLFRNGLGQFRAGNAVAPKIFEPNVGARKFSCSKTAP